MICAGLGIAEEDESGNRIGYSKGEYCLGILRHVLHNSSFFFSAAKELRNDKCLTLFFFPSKDKCLTQLRGNFRLIL